MSGWIITIIVCFLAGMGAGLGTGFADECGCGDNPNAGNVPRNARI